MERRSLRFGNVIQNIDFEKNIRLEKLITKTERILNANGYKKCHVPGVDYYGRYLTDKGLEGIQDLYKVVAGDGQMLALPNESTIALLNSLVLKRNETARYYGVMETYSFLKSTNPQNGYDISVVLTCANGYEAEAEICGLALEIASSLGLTDPMHLGNSEISQGIVDYYSQRAETKAKTNKIINGVIETESDFAAGQTLSELKKIKEDTPKSHVKELSKKLDNQRSLDGAVDLYEILNLLEEQGKTDRILIDPMCIGEEKTNGMTFYIGEDTPVIVGGRMIYVSGQESMNVISMKINLSQLAIVINTLPKEQPSRVGILVANSRVAYKKALKFKEDFWKNGLISEMQYRVTEEDANRKMSECDGKEYLVLYVAEDGNVKHN